MFKKTITFIQRQKDQIIQGGYRVLARKLKLLFPKMLRAPLYIIESPIGLIIFLTMRLVRSFFIIRIGVIPSNRIGHFSANLEIYLSEREAGINLPSKPHIDMFYCKIPIANKQLATMWSRVLHIGPRRIFKMVEKLNKFVPGGEIHVPRDWPTLDMDLHAGMILKKDMLPHINFTSKEEQRAEAELRAMGIPEEAPYVVLIVRDSAYLEEQNRMLHHVVDWSYHDHRDCDIQNYVLAAQELADRGYYVIRVGATVKEAMDVDHPMIIDYATNGMRTDFMDIYLGANCAFCISNGTGYDAVPRNFRKPILFIDHVPLIAIDTYNKNFLITTKNHWLRKENRFMTFQEIFRFSVHDGNDPFVIHEHLDIDLIESNPEEIKAAVIEMAERLSGKWQTSEEDEALQDRFWELFPSESNNTAFGHGEIRSRMGTDFLRQNRDLLNSSDSLLILDESIDAIY